MMIVPTAMFAVVKPTLHLLKAVRNNYSGNRGKHELIELPWNEYTDSDALYHLLRETDMGGSHFPK